MKPRATIVETASLTRRFGTFTAVDAVSFTVFPGEIFGLIGSNGAGKSTLVKMLTTMLPPTSGRAVVAGYDVVRNAANVRAHIGYVPQLLSADGALTGYENLLFAARLYLVPRAEREKRVQMALERMGLAEFADRLVQGYSGGMIRRLEIAQSTIHEPPVLFMDEPTGGLDVSVQARLLDLMRNLVSELELAAIVVTHDLAVARLLSHRVMVMKGGFVIETGLTDQVLDDPRELYTQLLVSSILPA